MLLGTLVLGYDTSKVSMASPYLAKIWYHIELRNLDWTARLKTHALGGCSRTRRPYRTAWLSYSVLLGFDTDTSTYAADYRA